MDKNNFLRWNRGLAPYNPLPPSLPRQALHPFGATVMPHPRSADSTCQSLLTIINDKHTMMKLLISTIITWFFQVFQSCWFMMFVPAPETPTWITFPETRMHFKHFFRTMGFKHNLSILQWIFFWNIYREMNMISSETKINELKPKTFQIPECLGTRINMRLFPEAVESAFSWKHHSHPVVPCVTCWFFIATTITNYHIFLFLSRLYEADSRRPAARGKKQCVKY